MPHVDLVLVLVALGSFIAGGLTILLITARRCEDEAQRRFIAGRESARTPTGDDASRDEVQEVAADALRRIADEYGGEFTYPLSQEVAAASVRPPGRLRRWTRGWNRDQERRARVAGMVDRGVGM